MNAELISVGTELLLGDILNTNVKFISQKLTELGIDVYFHTTVGDNKKRLIEALTLASQRADLLILTGGLGPTGDDLTKETLAEFLDCPLTIDPGELKKIQDYFQQRGRTCSANNDKQAALIKGGEFLPNDVGTAPGIAIQSKGKSYLILPGPPREMEPMFTQYAVSWLLNHPLLTSQRLYSYVLQFMGISESALEEKLLDLIENQTQPTIAPLAKDSGIHLRLTARAADEQAFQNLIEPVLAVIKRRLGQYIVATNEETVLSNTAKRLSDLGITVSTAESCTGGLLSASLTEMPGSSRFFTGSVVAYHNVIKEKILGVSAEALRQHGAVSQVVAEAMARGVRELTQSTIGIGITGLAGPEGGQADKPIGLVYIAIDSINERTCQRVVFSGQRQHIRLRTVAEAQKMLYHYAKNYTEKSCPELKGV